MTKAEYTERLARSLEWDYKTFLEREACINIAKGIMNDWLWDQMVKDTGEAMEKVGEYAYGGTHRHPLDMD